MNFIFSVVDYKSAIIRSVLAITIGVLFCMFPEQMANYSVWLIGAAIMLGGVVSFTAGRIFKNNSSSSGGGIISLVLAIAIGMLIIMKYEFFANFIMYCLGTLLIIGGAGQFVLVFGSRRIVENGMPVTAYLMPSLLIAVGLLICFNPFESKHVLFIIFGIGSIFYGINDLFSQIRLRKRLKKMGKIIRNGEVEDVDYEEVPMESDKSENTLGGKPEGDSTNSSSEENA